MGDAAFMTQSLITGIKRGSPMLIDNTGITLKLGRPRSIRQKRRKERQRTDGAKRSIAICGLRWKVVTLINKSAATWTMHTSDMQSAKIAAEELKTALGELFAPTLASYGIKRRRRYSRVHRHYQQRH